MPEPQAPQIAIPAQPPEVPPAKTPGLSLLTGLVAAVVVVAALYVAREVLLPITLAMLLSFLLSPLVELLRRARLGSVLSVIVSVILALGIILALGSAIGTQVAQLAKNVPQYQTTIENKISDVQNATIKRFSGRLGELRRQFGGGEGSAAPAPVAPAAPTSAGQQNAPPPLRVEVVQPAPSAFQIGKTILTPLLSPVATIGIILVVTIFALLQKEDIRDRAIRLFGSSDLERTTVAMDEAARRLSRYFLTQLGLNAAFGVIVAVGLYFIGVPNPMLWGILGALLRFIPYIGSWIAAALPILLAAAVEPGWSMAIWTAVLYVATELTMGQAVEPLVYGHSTGLSPLAVIVAAIFWTWIWGAIGLIISTPLTLCLVLLGRYVERLEFLDVLFGDRPALTPAESFYQRMLAGDPDEAVDQAERFLKDRPLSSYYDEVALKGLQLAANDVVRGMLEPNKVERLKNSTTELIHDLADYEDVVPEPQDDEGIAGPTADQRRLPKKPPPGGHAFAGGHAFDRDALGPEWRGENSVLCIAGRGPLDEAASRMLAQLLGKHGLGARVLAHESTARGNIEMMDLDGVAMICVSYLDISGNPAHLRYLLRRLRARLPDAPILVGLWPLDDPILKDAKLRQAVGADFYVATLHDAVEACLQAAHSAASRAAEPAAIQA
jgi:predicted PurR-regulated permease PerM